MRVAIVTESGESDAVRGIGVYTRELFNSLKDFENKDFKVDLVKKNDPKLNKYDLLHYPDFRVYFSYPTMLQGKKTVVTIHDVIPLIYPKQYPSGIRGSFKLLKQRILLKKVDEIITVSETSRKDIVRFLSVPVEKINVIYHAARAVIKKATDQKLLKNVKEKYNLPDKFVLYVGDVNYNKNVPTLIKACKIAGLPLVICGKNAAEVENNIKDIKSLKGPKDWLRFMLDHEHPETSHYKELVKQFGETSVIRTGFVPDEELAALYSLASVYCHISFYEGFGLGVLEAMACGTPVVISKTQALVEVFGGAALTSDQFDPKDIAEKLKMITTDRKLKENLVRKGSKLNSAYDWNKTAAKTLEVYRKTAKLR